MNKLVRSRGYLRWKRRVGYVYVVVGFVLLAQTLMRAHGTAQMTPGLLLGGAFVALGVIRIRSTPA